MRLLARGEASLYGAIVMSIILVIFASLYSVAVTNLARQGEAYREALRSYLEASRESIGFSRDPSGSIAAYSNTDSRIVYLIVANRSSILYSSRVDISLKPGVSAALISGDLASLVSSGSAYLAAFTSRGNVFIYREESVASNPGGDAVSSDLWASPLLAIARQMGDLIYSSPGTYWFSGDENQGQVRITFARSLVIGNGVALYTANPSPLRVGTYYYFGQRVEGIGAAGGVGVTRVIVADTIVISGVLSSKGLGGAGTKFYSYASVSTQAPTCGDPAESWGISSYTDYIRASGNVSSGGGGGSGGILAGYMGTVYCAGLRGGEAYLYGYKVPGGGGGGGSGSPGSPGSVIDYAAFLKALLLGPAHLLNASFLYGAGGGSGGGGGDPAVAGYTEGSVGGRGGGGIVIVCNRLVMNNGVIDASGEDGGWPVLRNGGGGGGGGAGAIFIYCGSIEGSGAIRALGGAGGPGDGVGKPGSRGGDGWVVIVAGYISPNIRIEVGNGYRVAAH